MLWSQLTLGTNAAWCSARNATRRMLHASRHSHVPRPPNTLRASRPCRRHAVTAGSTSVPVPYTLESLDFYAILGVFPTSDQRTIRQAYHSLMRDLHPDRAAARAAAAAASTASTDSDAAEGPELGSASASIAEAANDLCAIINEIYEVLSDEERRAKYDVLSGFSTNSVNPFSDSSFARDQIFVDELSCVGCGKCVRWAPGTFEIEESKYGRARVINQSGNTLDEIEVAIETCPVDCIHYVTLPQLSLLESVLATMARIDVAVMQRTKRSPGNVFQEAFKAHEKRQAAINAMLAGNSRPKVDWDFWGTGSLEKEEREEEQEETSTDPTQRRIAKLAAAAARAARMWRAYLKSRAALRTLTDGSSMDDPS